MKHFPQEVLTSLFVFVGWGAVFSALSNLAAGIITASFSAAAAYFVSTWCKQQFPDGIDSIKLPKIKWPWTQE